MENLRLMLLLRSLLIWLYTRNSGVEVLRIPSSSCSKPTIALDFYVAYNARTAVMRVRMKNLRLTSLPLSLLIWLYSINLGVKVLRMSRPLFSN